MPAPLPPSSPSRRNELEGLALTLWALVHGLAMLILDGRLDPDPQIPLSVQAEKWVEQVTTVLGRGLRHYVTSGPWALQVEVYLSLGELPSTTGFQDPTPWLDRK